MVPRVTLAFFGWKENFQPLSGIESTDLPVHGHRPLVRNLFVVFDCDILHLLQPHEHFSRAF